MKAKNSSIAGTVISLPLASTMKYLSNPLGLATALAIFMPQQVHAQTSYPMVCRGGGSMRIISSPDLRRDHTRIEIRFRKATAAYDFGRGLIRPGECAWLDRPINLAEPNLASVDLPVSIWIEFPATGSGGVNAGVSVGGSYGAARQFANDILRLSGREGLFTINARNTGRGYFEFISISEGA